MIDIKNKKEISLMQEGGKILARVLRELLQNIKPGVSELKIDQLAEKLIKKAGAESGFKKVPGYNYSICVSTNDVVVHGVPTDYKFKEGDIVGIDCGIFYKGFHTDMAQTLRVSTINNQQSASNENDEIDKFLETGKKALNAGIRQAKEGNRVGHISKAIQDIVEKQNGYSVVRSLIGHGVGRELHEEPEVPGFLDKAVSKTPLLKEGMTIAIEAIYAMGSGEVNYDHPDGWTVATRDHSRAAVFEHTLAIGAARPVVLTKVDL